MPRPKQHILVCGNRRPPGHPRGSCQDRGALDLMLRLRDEIEARGLIENVALSSTSCLGPCEEGATVVVYPDSVWYGGVGPDDVPEIVESHLRSGKPVERLLVPEEAI